MNTHNCFDRYIEFFVKCLRAMLESKRKDATSIAYTWLALAEDELREEESQ